MSLTTPQQLSLLPPPSSCVVHPACANQFRANVNARVSEFNQCVLATCTDYNVCQQRLISALQWHSSQAGQCAVTYNPYYGNRYGPYYGATTTSAVAAPTSVSALAPYYYQYAQ